MRYLPTLLLLPFLLFSLANSCHNRSHTFYTQILLFSRLRYRMVNSQLVVAATFAFVGAGLFFASYYGQGGAGHVDGIDGSHKLYGETFEFLPDTWMPVPSMLPNATILMTSTRVDPGSGTSGTDFKLKYEFREYDEVSNSFKVNFFNGEDKVFVFTHWPHVDRLELIDCGDVELSSVDLANSLSGSPTFFDVSFDADGEPASFGDYTIKEFEHGKFGDDIFTTGVANFTAAQCDDVVNRRLASAAVDAEAEERRLGDWTVANQLEAESCKWYQALFKTEKLANVPEENVIREGYEGDSTTCSDPAAAGECCKHRYPNTGGNFIVSDPGFDELLTCKAPSDAFDTLQLWGTNSDNDIMNDISITSTSFSGGVHSGVNNEANDVMGNINPSQMGSKVLVSGFSLGGATAHQVASRLKHDHGKEVTLITGGEFASMEDTDPRAIHGEHYRVIAEQWQHDWTISCFWDVVPGLGFTWEHPSGSHPLYIRKTTHASTCTTSCTCRNQNTVHWKCAWCGRSDCVAPCSCSGAGEEREVTGNGGCAHIGQCRSNCNTVCTPNPPTYTVSANRCDHGYSYLNPVVNPLTAWSSSMAMMAGGYSEPGMIDGHTFNYKKFVGKGMCGLGGAGSNTYPTTVIDNMGDAGTATCQDNPDFVGYANMALYDCSFWEDFGYCANGAPRYWWVNNYKQDGYNRGNLGPADACCACGGGL